MLSKLREVAYDLLLGFHVKPNWTSISYRLVFLSWLKSLSYILLEEITSRRKICRLWNQNDIVLFAFVLVFEVLNYNKELSS